MKQLSQNLRSGNLSTDKLPSPKPQPGEVLVSNAFSLISAGTERTKIETGNKSLVGKAISRPDQVEQVIDSIGQIGLKSTIEKVITRLNARSPLGYSSTGTVLEISPGITEFSVGDGVACGGASAAHAEIISVPINLCAKVPENVLLKEAAFTTVGAIAMQGVRLADVQVGEVALVIGLGLVGQLAVQILQASGCYVIGYDLDEKRCQLAINMGADFASSQEKNVLDIINQYTGSQGADAVIITAATDSNRPVEFAGEICRKKGRVVVVGAVGLNIPREPYYNKELDFKISCSYGPGRYDTLYEEKGQDYPYGYVRWTEKRNMESFLALLARKKIDVEPLITDIFKLSEAEKAYAAISGQGEGDHIAVLFEYAPEPELSESIRVNQRHPVEGALTIGVIGAGNFAQSMLLPHLQSCSECSLHTVVTRSPLKSRDAAERFGFEVCSTDPQTIFDDEAINAVVIATRHDSHAELALTALKNGKAIHLEKPLALNPLELEKIEKEYWARMADNENPLKPFLMVGFNRRFAPMVQQAAEFMQNRTEPLTMLYRINAGYIPSDHWTQDDEVGGGRIIGEVCHFIDLLQFFSGAKVVRVFAQQMPDLGKYNRDNVTVNLSFEDGSIGTILYTANGDRKLSKEYIEAYSQGKVVVLDNFRLLKMFESGKKKTSRKGARDKGHKNEVLAWIDAIRQGEPEPVPFEMAVAATKASFAINKSIQTGEAINVSYD